MLREGGGGGCLPGESDGVEVVENPDCSDAATTGHCCYDQNRNQLWFMAPQPCDNSVFIVFLYFFLFSEKIFRLEGRD